MSESAAVSTRDQTRLQQLSLAVWEMEQLPREQLREPLVRRQYLRAQQQLLAEQEAVADIAPEARSRLLLREESPSAALLVHGSTGVPSDLQGLADSLHASGLTVWNLRLPGHGLPGVERPPVTWRACANAVRRAFGILDRCHERVHLVGFSFGAALAVVLTRKVRPASLALLSPALLPRVPWRFRILLWLRMHRLPWLRRRFGWDLEVLEAMQQARAQIGRLRLPVYAAHCDDDERIDPGSLRLLQRRVKDRVSRFRLYPQGGHMILRAHGPAGLYREIQDFLEADRAR